MSYLYGVSVASEVSESQVRDGFRLDSDKKTLRTLRTFVYARESVRMLHRRTRSSANRARNKQWPAAQPAHRPDPRARTYRARGCTRPWRAKTPTRDR